MTAIAHIRGQQPRIRGNGYYRVKGPKVPNLCGATWTTEDVRRGDVRSLRGATSWRNGCDETGWVDVELCDGCRARFTAGRAV